MSINPTRAAWCCGAVPASDGAVLLAATLAEQLYPAVRRSKIFSACLRELHKGLRSSVEVAQLRQLIEAAREQRTAVLRQRATRLLSRSGHRAD